ncbi:MAG: hypothetical protein ACTHLT_02615 [Devosia sp.]
MATLVGLTQGQIDRLLDDLEQVESGLKSMYDELAQVPVPRETLARFAQIHNRYSSAITFLQRQRELKASDRSPGERT